MQSAPSSHVLAQALPGLWKVRASNLVHWLSAERLDPVVEMTATSHDPLTVTIHERYSNPEGKGRSVRRTAVLTPYGFVGSGSGFRRLSRSNWSVPWVSSDGAVVLIVHDLGRARGDGIELLVRENESARDVRATVTAAWGEFGLKPEDLAKLSWFAV